MSIELSNVEIVLIPRNEDSFSVYCIFEALRWPMGRGEDYTEQPIAVLGTALGFL